MGVQDSADFRRLHLCVLRLALPCLLVVLAALIGTGNVSAAQLIDRDATGVTIAVDAKGEALLTYRKDGAVKHVLVWGAVNALPPTEGAQQVKFSLDYAGGWGKYHTLYWKTFPGSVRAVHRPRPAERRRRLHRAGRLLLGGAELAAAAAGSRLHAVDARPPSCTGSRSPTGPAPVAQLEVGMDWVYSGRFQDLFGRYTYQGTPVYGFGTTAHGAPTDGFGRLVYLDTYNSVYGPGWRRENSFVSHNPTGAFCYGFYPFDPTKGLQVPAGADCDARSRDGREVPPLRGGPGRDPGRGEGRRRRRARTTRATRTTSRSRQLESAVLLSYGDNACRAGH